MSLNKIKGGITNRAAKIREMEFQFDSDAKIDLYRTVSKKILVEDYQNEVKAMLEADKQRLSDIEQQYRKSMKTPTERVQSLHLAQAEYKSLSSTQLKAAAEDALQFPASLSDLTDLQALAGELRSRGDSATADSISVFVVGESIATPWVHNEQYRSLQARAKKLGVYQAQAAEGSMLILSEDVNHIAESDIVMLDSIDAGLPEGPS